MKEDGPRFLDEEGEQDFARSIRGGATVEPIEDPPLPHGPVLLEPETGAPDRLTFDWQPGIIRPARLGSSAALWFSCGVGFLLATWIGFSLLTFVLRLFHASHGLGGLMAVMIAFGGGMLGYGFVLEWRGYRSLGLTEELRAVLMGNDLPITTIRTTCLAWVRRVNSDAKIDVASVADGLRIAETADEIRILLHSRVADRLREASLQVGRRAAIEASVLEAVCPHPALDGLIVGIRALAMMRQIAGLYGVRPGFAVTIALARRVAVTAAGTTAIDIVSQGLASQLFSHLPVLKHIAATIPGAGMAAVRIYRLAGITSEACCPVQPR